MSSRAECFAIGSPSGLEKRIPARVVYGTGAALFYDETNDDKESTMSGAMHPPDPEEPRREGGEARPPSDGEEQASVGGMSGSGTSEPSEAGIRRPEVLEKGAVYDRSRENTERLIRENRNFVADYVDSFAHGLGSMARSLEGEGRNESATQIHRVAGELERASKKVREESLVKTARQVEARARERPVIAFGGAALAGFALSRVLKSRPAHDDGQED